MTSSALDYPKVFNRLCHMVALTKDGKTDAAIDDIILTLFVLDSSLRPPTARAVADALKSTYGLVLPEVQVQGSLDRHLSTKRILRDVESEIYQLAPHVRSSLHERIEVAVRFEEQIRDEWINSLDPALRSGQESQLWSCLRSYMAKVFYRHGVETIQLLDPSVPVGGEAEKSLNGYLTDAIRETGGITNAAFVHSAVQSFFLNITSQRTQYLAQLLDGTFTFFALSIDDATSSYLQGTLTPLKIFLDTNYIFAILRISANPFVEASQELIELIKTNNFPFELLYHEETLEEMSATINSIATPLKSRRWQSQSSRFAVASGKFEGLVLRYHERNAVSPVDPAIFLAPYEQLVTLLKSHGFEDWHDQTSEEDQSDRKWKLIAEYKAYMEAHRPRQPKPYKALNHDIEVWLTVQKLRNTSLSKRRSVLDVGALFLTNDTYFRRFDWEELREKDAVGSVVLPHHFLQLLRPFVPPSEDFNRRFVETFASPEFRSTTNGDPETAYKVLSYINAYRNIDERTAVHMLTDEMLTSRLHQAGDNSVEFESLLENAVLQQNAQLLEDKEALEEERRLAVLRAEQAEQLAAQRANEAQATQSRLEQTEAAADEAQRKVREAKIVVERLHEQQEQREHARDGEVRRLREQVEAMQAHSSRNTLIVRACTIFALSLFCVAVLTRAFIWLWWLEHSHRIGLLICAVLASVGTTWAIVEPPQRRWAIVGIAFVAIGVIAQIA